MPSIFTLQGYNVWMCVWTSAWWQILFPPPASTATQTNVREGHCCNADVLCGFILIFLWFWSSKIAFYLLLFTTKHPSMTKTWLNAVLPWNLFCNLSSSINRNVWCRQDFFDETEIVTHELHVCCNLQCFVQRLVWSKWFVGKYKWFIAIIKTVFSTNKNTNVHGSFPASFPRAAAAEVRNESRFTSDISNTTVL